MRKRKILSEDALQNNPISTEEVAVTVADIRRELEAYADPVKREYPVSYTHLTLPTICSV